MANTAGTFTAIASGTADNNALAAAAGRRLLGYSIRESAATQAVATVILRHGTADTDPALALIELAASGSETQWLGDRGIHVPDGVRIDRVAGETEVVLYHVTGV